MTARSLSPDFHKRLHVIAAAVLLAVIFSAVAMAPSFFQRADADYPYQGIHILGPDGEVYYAARVREVYDGFPGLGNVFFSAPKDVPYIQPPMPEVTIATLGRLVGVDALTAFLGSKVILSFAVFLLLFTFLFVVTSSPWISLVSASAVLFGGALLSAPWDLPHFFGSTNHEFEFLRFSRAINPQWSVSWFLAALTGLAAWIRFGKRRFLLLTTAATVILVYSYVYAWTYVFVVLGLLSLWYLMRRDWWRVSSLVLYWLAVIALATPYAIHLYALSSHPWYAESSMRLGVVLRHGPLILGVWLAVFFSLGFVTRRLWPRAWPLLPILPLAGLIALNQHIVTGHYIVPHHYHWYFIQPLASAFAVATLLALLSPLVRPRYGAAIGSLVILLSVGVAMVQQWQSYEAVSPMWGALQKAAPILDYVQKTMRPGHTVFTQDVNVANQVPIYTGADVYFAGNATNSLVPKERARYTYFFELWLQGVRPEQAEKEFASERRWMLSTRLYSIYYREAKGNFVALPDEEVEESIAEYRNFVRMPLREKLVRYPLSAVITTPGDPVTPVWKQFLACTKEAFRRNGFSVRLVTPSGEQGSCL